MSVNKEYYRVMLGKAGAYSADGRANNWIGANWEFDFDLTENLTLEREAFKRAMRPIYLERNPDRSKVAAGLACGMLYTICKDMKQGDVILSPDGLGAYHVGVVTGHYFYVEGEEICHRRRIDWYAGTIARAEMSQPLRNSTGSIGTVSNVTKHGEEIERLIAGDEKPRLLVNDEVIEDPTVFAMEAHLEEFLVRNWSQTELGRTYNIYEEDGEMVGRQYPSDTGPMDILAISKDGKELLVVELKRGRASDAVVGQILRYMGYVKNDLAEDGQTVRGAIIALEDDLKLRNALSMTQGIDFYSYQVSFRLQKGGVQ